MVGYPTTRKEQAAGVLAAIGVGLRLCLRHVRTRTGLTVIVLIPILWVLTAFLFVDAPPAGLRALAADTPGADGGAGATTSSPDLLAIFTRTRGRRPAPTLPPEAVHMVLTSPPRVVIVEVGPNAAREAADNNGQADTYVGGVDGGGGGEGGGVSARAGRAPNRQPRLPSHQQQAVRFGQQTAAPPETSAVDAENDAQAAYIEDALLQDAEDNDAADEGDEAEGGAAAAGGGGGGGGGQQTGNEVVANPATGRGGPTVDPENAEVIGVGVDNGDNGGGGPDDGGGGDTVGGGRGPADGGAANDNNGGGGGGAEDDGEDGDAEGDDGGDGPGVDAAARDNPQAHDPEGTTVVLLVSRADRANDVVRVVRRYLTPPYRHAIKRLIVSVEAGELAVPSDLGADGRLLILRDGRAVSGDRGRWTDVLPFVETESVLLHSDDVWAAPDALHCLLGAWRAHRGTQIVTSAVQVLDLVGGGGEGEGVGGGEGGAGEMLDGGDEGAESVAVYPVDPGAARTPWSAASAGTAVRISIATQLAVVPTELVRAFARVHAQHRSDPGWLPVGDAGGWCDSVGLSLLGTTTGAQWPVPVRVGASGLFNHAGCEERASPLEAAMAQAQWAGLVAACLPQFLPLIGNVRTLLAKVPEPATAEAVCPTVAPAVQLARARGGADADGFLASTACEADALARPLAPTGRPFNLGIVAGEFWSYEVDRRRGGFGFAAMMLARAFAAHPALQVSPYFLHVITPPPTAANVTHLHGVPLIFHDRDSKRYRATLEALQLDMIIAIEFRTAHMKVINMVPTVPLVIWVHDPHSRDIVHKIKSLHIPTERGWAMPQVLSPSVATMRSSLRTHERVLFALTSEYFRPFYQEAYNVSIGGGYEPPLLPYMMDVFAGTEEATLVGQPAPRPRIIYIGRLDPVKRPWIFVEVARQLPDIEFVMLGSLYTTVNPIGFNYSEATAVPPNLRLTGHIEGRAKRELIASSWILLSTAIHEGLPFSFIEALQSGVPVVATHNPENVTERFGAYVGNHKEGTGLQAVPALVAAIERLVRDGATRTALGHAGRRWVTEWLNTNNFMAALRGLIGDTAANRYPTIADRDVPTAAAAAAAAGAAAAGQAAASGEAATTTSSRPRVPLAICAVFRNEDDALAEWIEFHRLVGVERFYLYHMDDHVDRDRWRTVLWPYVSRGIVELDAQVTSFLGQKANRQSATLQRCLDTHAANAAWIAFIDVDEYLVPAQAGVSVPTLLDEFEPFTGLILPWRTFGPAEQEERFPSVTKIFRATPFDRRDGPIPRMAGTIKVIVHTENPVAVEHCRFMQTGGFDKDGRFVHYAHNCLYNAPSPPVDVQRRPVPVPWNLPHGASGSPLQLQHYFARSCTHFQERKNTRLASIQARYGNTTQPWFNSRIGVGLGNTPEEVCQTLRAFFNTTDTTMEVHVPALTKAMADAAARSRASVGPPLPARGPCTSCHALALCVDVLAETARCVCAPGYYGDGTFCGTVRWPLAVTAPPTSVANMSYLLSPPDGNVYSPAWKTRPLAPVGSDGRAVIELAFVGADNGVDDDPPGVAGVVAVLIYQPFNSGTLAAIHAKPRSPGHPSGSVLDWEPLWTRETSGLDDAQLSQPFLDLAVPSQTVHTLRITLALTEAHSTAITTLGGVAILAPAA